MKLHLKKHGGERKSKGTTTIKKKILGATVSILTLSILAVGSISVYMNYSSLVKSVEQTLSQAVQIAVNQVDRNLQEYRTLVSELAVNDHIISGDKAELSAELKAIEKRHNLTMAERTDADGNCIVTGSSVADRDYFIQARDTQKAYVSDPISRKDDGTLNLFVSAPVMKDGKFDGIFFIGLDANFLCDMVADIKVGGTGNSAILNKDGTTIAYADVQTVLDAYNTQDEVKNDPSLERLAALEREMTKGNTGFGDYSYGGVEKFFAYTPVPNTNGWSMDISVVKSELLQGANTSIILIVVATIICLLIAVFFFYRLSSTIANPIRMCVERIQLLAKGDLKTKVPEIHTRDETYLLAEATGTIVKTMDGIIGDLTYGLGEMAHGNFMVKSKAEELYMGDFAPINSSMLQIIERLTKILTQINQSADEVSGGSDQVADGAQGLSQGATQQASAVEQLAATINEMSAQVTRNADSAQEVADKAAEVGNEAGESDRRMSNMLTAMEEISASSSEIGKIIKTIEDIAFQTNILALNAAVEAARAGEAGKGFAVVADEVRDLASKSAEASKNTTAMIENSLHAVENGTKIADDTAHSLRRVVSGMEEVADTIKDISKASSEQSSSIVQITQGIEQISGVVQSNSATAEESAAASEELSGQAQMLKELIGQFRLGEVSELS